MTLHRTALALLASLATSLPAYAGDAASRDDFRAELGWRLAFGGADQPLQAGYALSVGYRAEGGAPAVRLLGMDATTAGTIASLAGFPVMATSPVSQASGDDAQADWRTEPRKPWYQRQWVWWTGAGIAAAGILVNGFVHSIGDGIAEGFGGSGNPDDGSNSTGVTGVGTNDDGTSVGCVNGNCAAHCTDSTDPTTCTFTAIDRLRYLEQREHAEALDAGTGRMGDLIAR